MERLVYFIAAPNVNLIKIGSSRYPEERLVALRLLSPVPLEIMTVMPGGYAQETALHGRFKHLRSHGEWFHATGELRSFIWRTEFLRVVATMDAEQLEWARQWMRDHPNGSIADNTTALRAVQ